MKNGLQWLSGILLLAGPLFAKDLQVQHGSELPPHCRLIGEIKVGDIAMGKPRPQVESELKTEAAEMGGNYLLMDIKRVNHPKMGIYYWGWGVVGYCSQ